MGWGGMGWDGMAEGCTFCVRVCWVLVTCLVLLYADNADNAAATVDQKMSEKAVT